MPESSHHRPSTPSRRVPRPPSLEHWPVAVQAAERLSGTLLPCGPGVRLVSWPDTPAVRLAALPGIARHGFIPVLMSAAWVWGCSRDLATPFDVMTSDGRRVKRLGAPLIRVHQFRYRADDVERLSTGVVTTPVRTVCDLLRFSTDFSRETVVACRLLLHASAEARERVLDDLLAGRHQGRARALARFERC